MIGLIQRVTRAKVEIAGEICAEIAHGLLVLVCIERDDGEEEVRRLAQRLVAYRVFADEAGKMNRSVRDVGGSLLLVPQFTLAADTSSGLRPSFSGGASPELGTRLFEALAAAVAGAGVPTACGRFGAYMQVSLTNDGPVTFWLRTGSKTPKF